MWQHDNDMASSYSSIDLLNDPKPQEDIWQLRTPSNPTGQSFELQQQSSALNDDASSVDSWAASVISRSSWGSSMSINSGISSANTTPGGSPTGTPTTKKKKLNLKPALKLNMDNVTWTTTKYKKRKHKYKKNIQASSAKMRAMMKQSRNPQFRFRMVLLTLFALIVTIVSFTWHMYQRQLLQVAIGDKIRFHEARRVLHLLKKDGTEKVEAVLGSGIPEDLNPYQCGIQSNICEEWKYRAKLLIDFSHSHNLSCYNINWYSLSRDTILKDCIALKNAHWYGMGLQSRLQWPLQVTPGEESYPLVTGNGIDQMFGGIIDRYWLSSDGVAVSADPNVPLYVSINENYLCLESRNDKEFPYHKTHPINLKYTICTGRNMRTLHQDMLLNYRSLMTDTTGEVFLDAPLWSSSPSSDLNQNSIQDFANRIMEHTLRVPGFLLLDKRWQSQDGSLDFNKNTFPNPEEILKILHHKGFRVMLAIHPFVCLPSPAFQMATQGNHLLTDEWKYVPLLTRYNSKVCGLLDLTNNVTANWFLDRLLYLRNKYDIDGFLFTGGQTTYLPRYYAYHASTTNPDSFLQHYLSIAMSLNNSILGTEVGFLTQNFPGFVHLTPRTVSWDSFSGLGSVISEVLTLGILGYPLVNPGSVGGDGGGEIPSKELYLRWMELVVFLPITQFTVEPDDYDQEVIETLYTLFKVREELVLPIYRKALQQFSESAAPLVRPIWWIAPNDPHAQTSDSQFLVGQEIMVAPVIEDGRRSRDIYLPAGWWKDHLLGEIRRGGKWLHNYPVPLTKVAYFSVTEKPL